MLATILSLFTSQLPRVIREIAQARVDLSKTQNERERILVEERIRGLEARRDVLIAQPRWALALVAVILVPFAFYLWWIIGWDKIACKWFFEQGVCTTDPLSPWLEGIFGSILALLTLKKV